MKEGRLARCLSMTAWSRHPESPKHISIRLLRQ
jgi:hypothetical protein